MRIATNYSLVESLTMRIYGWINKVIIKIKFQLIYFNYYSDEDFKAIQGEIIKGDLILSVVEALQLQNCVKDCLNLKGDIAEIGVYNGGSARIIAELKKSKRLLLFDTFDGLPDKGEIDNYLKDNLFKVSLEYVKKKLKKYKFIYFYPGFFPDSAKNIKKYIFCFVHIDTDLYISTLDCLNFFYPKMVKNGVMLIHDYPYLPGVKKAVDEFVKDSNLAVIKMVGNQALIVKS